MSATLVIDGHPNPHSLCAALARSYADGNPGARLIALRDLEFDIHMRHGYTQPMPIEPDLADARQAIRDAKHLVVVTPVWWRSVPALLKGRSARVLITADTPLVLQRLMPDTRLASLTKGTLRFCGLKPVTVNRFTSVNKSTPEKRAKWLEQAKRYGEQDAARVGTGRALSSATA